MRLTIYKKAEREGIDPIISQLGTRLAKKLFKYVFPLYITTILEEGKKPQDTETTRYFIIIIIIFVDSNTLSLTQEVRSHSSQWAVFSIRGMAKVIFFLFLITSRFMFSFNMSLINMRSTKKNFII